MLKKFQVINYKNLDVFRPMELGMCTGVYGKCAAGKTNLCEAVQDICVPQNGINYQNEQKVQFLYEFEMSGNNIICEYERNLQGMISFLTLRMNEKLIFSKKCIELYVKDVLRMIDDKVLSEIEKDTMDSFVQITGNREEKQNKMIKVVDDLDLYKEKNINQWKSMERQLFFTTRRPHLFESNIELQYSYWIQNGKVEKIIDSTPKYIKTKAQIVNFLSNV